MWVVVLATTEELLNTKLMLAPVRVYVLVPIVGCTNSTANWLGLVTVVKIWVSELFIVQDEGHVACIL